MNNEDNQKIKNQYDNIAGIYDAVDWFIPSSWRSRATGFAYGHVLEVGIGTGLNLSFYTERCQEICGIDVSPGMLDRAMKRVSYCKSPVKLEVMDVQKLPLPPGSFDCVLAAFVFCTVPEPSVGLRECYRVLKPGGKLILLEHMGSENRLFRPLMEWLNPFVVKLMGDHINRDTAKDVANVGFKVGAVNNLLGDIVRLIVAEK